MTDNTKNNRKSVKNMIQVGIEYQEAVFNKKNMNLLYTYMGDILNNTDPKKTYKNLEDVITLYNTAIKNMSDLAKKRQVEFFGEVAKFFEPKPDVKTGEIKPTQSSIIFKDVLLLKEQSDNILKLFKNQYNNQVKEYENNFKSFQSHIMDIISKSEYYPKIKNLTGYDLFTTNIENDGISVKIPKTVGLNPGDKVWISVTKIIDNKNGDENV